MIETNVLEIVRSYFPDLPDEELEHILWGRTGYPSFFINEEPVAVLKKQLKEYAAAKAKYVHICDFCNLPGLVFDNKCLCATHKEMIST